MIRVLHIMSSLGGGGIEKMLFEYYSNMDRKEFIFDFAVHGKKEGFLEKKITAMGSLIYHITPKKESFIKNFLEIKKCISNGNYDVVVVHQNFSSFSALIAAKLCKVKVRIVHSHGYIPDYKLTIEKKIYRSLNNVFATAFAACSPEAADWLYGERNKSTIVYNAIDVDKFKFSSDNRTKMREMLNIRNDEICLLQVGRFSDGKNHKFSIDILKNLNNKKYKMVFAGDGESETIKQYVKENHLEEQVVFLGCIDDVGSLMCAGDILMFPSKDEGFGIVAVEAQMSGCHVLASDRVPRSTRVSDNIEYLPLDNKDEWIDKIQMYKIDCGRKSVLTEKFNIKVQAKSYENYLKCLVEKNNGNIFG